MASHGRLADIRHGSIDDLDDFIEILEEDGNSALRSYYRSAGYSELDAVESQGSLVRLFEKALSPVPATA